MLLLMTDGVLETYAKNKLNFMEEVSRCLDDEWKQREDTFVADRIKEQVTHFDRQDDISVISIKLRERN